MKTAVRLLALVGAVAAFIPTSIAQLHGQAQYDLLIRHGRIVDGTGAPWYGTDSVRSSFFFSIAQTAQPDWAKIEEETMRHFQAILRFDTSNPPGNEMLVVDYLKSVLDGEGIETKVFALDPRRPNLVARLRGSGKKRPVLIRKDFWKGRCTNLSASIGTLSSTWQKRTDSWWMPLLAHGALSSRRHDVSPPRWPPSGDRLAFISAAQNGS